MRRYFTRALALALAFTLAFALLPGAALAAPATEVYVGGTDVSAGGYWTTDGTGTLTACTSVDAWNVHYETATAGNAILTLKDARITGAHHEGKERCGVYANGDLTLRLLGDSAVGGPALDNPGDLTTSTGVYVKGELTIMGGGSLVSTGGKGTFSYGVLAGDLHMRGGTLMANGGAADWQSAGVIVTGGGGQQSRLTMEKGRLTGTGGPAAGVTGGMGAFSIGVGAGKITMLGGDLTGTGGTADMVGPESTSAGVSSAGNISMEDGRLTGTGGTAGKISYGVVTTYAGITMNGGRLTGTGGTAGEASYGVNTGGPNKPDTVLTVLGGEVTAQSLGARPTAQAFDKAPAIGPAYAAARVWYGADAAAALAQGPQAPKDAPADYWREKYAKVYVPVYAPSDAGLTYRTLRHEATGIEARGYFSEDAALSVQAAALHPAGACAACDEIRARQAAGEPVLLWDISLATGHYSGGFEMRFPVGAKYNGQTVTLLHCRDNMLESQSALVENGAASGMFGGFSPFAVAAGGGTAGIPKTGDGPALWLGLALVALAAGAYGLARRRKA